MAVVAVVNDIRVPGTLRLSCVECVQELKASAFAGNPETLSQFCRAEETNAPQRGLSRAVVILDAPLVEGKSQVCLAARTCILSGL